MKPTTLTKLTGLAVYLTASLVSAQTAQPKPAAQPKQAETDSNPATDTGHTETDSSVTNTVATNSAATSTDTATTTTTTTTATATATPTVTTVTTTAAEPASASAPETKVTKTSTSAQKPVDLQENDAPKQTTAAKAHKTEARAKVQVEPPPPDYSELPQTYHLWHVDVALGPRLSSMTHDGLQPYMRKPVTGEFVGRLSATVAAPGPWALAVVAQGSGFERRADVRGVDTSLTVMGFGAGVEARYHMHHRVFAYARILGGAELAKMHYGDDFSRSTDADASNWAFFGDAALGAAVRIIGSSDGRKRAPRVWLFLEGGGRLATKHQAELEVDEDGPNRADPIVLPSFATNGVNVSGGVMMSF